MHFSLLFLIAPLFLVIFHSIHSMNFIVASKTSPMINLCNSTQPAITCSTLTTETLEQRSEICSKLTIKPPKRRQWRHFVGFIVNFEHILHLCSRVSIDDFEQVNADWHIAS